MIVWFVVQGVARKIWLIKVTLLLQVTINLLNKDQQNALFCIFT